MTNEELEARLLQLEARLLVEPRAAAPITIGELLDVPAPGSPIASPWAQEVSNRIRHRFATLAALNAWAAADGSHAWVDADKRIYSRVGGAWVRTEWAAAAGRTWFDAAATVTSLASGNLVPITWGTENADTDGLGNGTTNITITAATAGLWLVSATCYIAANPVNGLVRLRYGSGNPGQIFDVPISLITFGACATALIPLVAADILQVHVLQNSGAAINLSSGSLRMCRLGP